MTTAIAPNPRPTLYTKTINAATTGSTTAAPIPGLEYGFSDGWGPSFVSLCVPYLYLKGGAGDPNVGVIVSLMYSSPEYPNGTTLVSGGFTNVAQGMGRLPITLTASVPELPAGARGYQIYAEWAVVGQGVTAVIDSTASLTVKIGRASCRERVWR